MAAATLVGVCSIFEARDAARMARVDKPRASGRCVGRVSASLTERCYTGVTGRPVVWIGTPVTRSLPARFEAYIAPSALMISSSAVCPSSG